MNVKSKALSAGVAFFIGLGTFSAQSQSDTLKTEEIEEVIVLGYVKRKATEVTGNSIQLSNEKINTPSAISVDQALQGLSPGVQVSASSGTPGSVQDIRIRGVGSLSASNAPLFVIDGVPVINGNSSASSASSSLTTLASINNQDIESMTILKDASATAAYGARGSNGVILITTKRGRSGKARFNLNTSIGFQNDAYMKRHGLSGAQKLELLKEALVNSYGKNYGVTLDNAVQFAAANGIDGGASLWTGEEYNWEGLLQRKNALTTTADLSVSGGDNKSTYYASLGHNKTEATVIGPAFERISAMFKYTNKLTDKLNFETSINGSWVSQNPILEGGSYFGNPFITKVLMNPWANPFNADGSYNIDDIGNFTSIHNTLYSLDNNITRNKMMRGISNTKVDYKILRNLTFSTRFNLDFILNDYRNYQNRYHGDGDGTLGYSERQMATDYTWVSQNSLNYNFRLGDNHRFDLTGVFEHQKYQAESLYGYGENFPADGLTNIASAGANHDASSAYSDWLNTSYLGMLNYSFADRLIIDGTIRREGSSRFAKGKRFGTFWSVGGAYNLHRDIFQDAFNLLRVRASYGLTGNSGVGINAYQALLSYDADYDGNGAAYPSVFGNPDLTWEKNKTFDVGVEFEALDRRLTGSIAYFNKRTYDLLQNVPLSRTTGFTSQAQNVGEVSNKGIEAMLGYDIIRTENVNWNVSANYATLENKVEKLALDGNGNPVNPSAGSSYKNTEVGQPIGYWYMPTWAGVNVDTGAPEWYINGVDGEKTSNINLAARHNQGTAIPKYTGGFQTGLTVHNVFFNANVYFAGGHKIYEQYAQFYMRRDSFALSSYNGVEELMERWQKPGDVTDVPKVSFSNDNFQVTNSRHLYDGTFARLKDVTLGYNLPKSVTNALGVDGLALSVRGTNMYTWTKDKDLKLDPETQANGYTTLTTPPVKSIIFGVNLKF